jgi:long-subunit acyl-CoA synthetase (AMP-forming)
LDKTPHKNILLKCSQERYCEWELKDDKIAVISSSNRTEWNIMDIGILQTGRKTQNSIYPTITEDDYIHIEPLQYIETKTHKKFMTTFLSR